MSHSRLIAIPCKISRGVVSDERAFEVVVPGGKTHSGVAPAYYFWTQGGERLGSEEPRGDQEVQGMVAARLLARESDKAHVSIPDGSVIIVDSNAIAARPSEVVIDVPVGPRS